QSLSSFAGNPLLISPDWLIEDGLLRARDSAAWSFSATAVHFDAVKRFKRSLLDAAWKNLSTGTHPDLRLAFEHFGEEQAHWLDDYALFRALKARYSGASYLEWPEELVRRTPAALDQARRDLASEVQQVRFAQFLLSRQGARLKAHARAKGVRLIGDLPFFVSPDSSDVWAYPELFLLDAQRRPPVVAEDLGISTPDVGELRDAFHVPGTRVLQFAFDGHSDNPYLPDNYVPNTVVYTGTHDNPTTRGWYEDLSDAERRNLWRYVK